MHLFKTLPILFVIGIIGLIVSCEDDKTTNPQDQAPTIPPQSSMIINFDDFPDTSSLNKINHSQATKRNWGWAAYNVVVWNSVLTLTLAVPVAAFTEAFNHQPVKQSDGRWLWQYSVSVNEAVFTAKLFGKIITEGVEWQMLLSQQGVFEDFEWFTGFSNTAVTEGTWTLNKDPNTPSPLLFIEWERNPQEGTADVKYTLITPTTPSNGSYIYYGKTTEVLFNRFYNIYNAEQNNLIEIKWNYESHYGKVKDSIYFADQNWHCWDERLDDSECTE